MPAGRAEGLYLRGIELAVDDLLALGQQQDKVARAQIKLAGAVILQAVKLRVVAVAPAQLEGTAAVHEQTERVGTFDLLELGAEATYLLPSGMGVAESASVSGAIRLEGTSSHTRP